MVAQADYTGTRGADLDPRITYPCYQSFDEFIGVGRLRSLNAVLADQIGRYARAGERMILLTEPERPFNYYDLDRTELWRPTAAAEEFLELMDFIETLPFEATGRVFIMYDAERRPVPAHQDHLDPSVCHEFVWFRTNLEKPFYVLNPATGEKLYVESYSAWFDTVNQYHGTDGREGLTFSVRVDGHFTKEFRQLIPRPAVNPASAPALWACGARP